MPETVNLASDNTKPQLLERHSSLSTISQWKWLILVYYAEWTVPLLAFDWL